MFWITLRQYNQERWEARNSSTIADMVAPLQIGVGAATTGTSGCLLIFYFLPMCGQYLFKYNSLHSVGAESFIVIAIDTSSLVWGLQIVHYFSIHFKYVQDWEICCSKLPDLIYHK